MIIADIVDLVVTVFWLAILGRVLLSWFPNVSPRNPLVVVIYQITEPILGPLRRVLPRIGMIDLSPMVAIILLFIIARMVTSLAR